MLEHHQIYKEHQIHKEYIMESLKITSKIVKKMSRKDLLEFYARERPLPTFIANLRVFLEAKYVEAENTMNREYYGNLCNLAHYPGWYVYFDVIIE